MFERAAMPRLTVPAMLALLLACGAAWAETAREIVAASDKIRNPDQPFRTTVTLIEYIAGKANNQNMLTVYAKEDSASRQFRNLIRYIEPPRDEGKIVLLDGLVMWFFDPNSKASVRISPQQRLIGQAAIGDILTVNLAVDYNGELVGDEVIQDTERKDRQCWHLDMKATNDLATYNRVEYWVEHDSNRPIKAKFYADSGRLLKILYYRGFEENLGLVRPSEGVIIDAVDKSLATTFKFSDYRYQELPDAWFQREYLPRLRNE
ncbi:MAG: outer membrane lipoprotein-sorting protein [Methylomonas sp.]|jgi:outer membrane lipoprotein-sorting protein